MITYEVDVIHRDAANIKVASRTYTVDVEDSKISVHKYIEDVEAEASHKATQDHLMRFKMRKGDTLEVSDIREVERNG